MASGDGGICVVTGERGSSMCLSSLSSTSEAQWTFLVIVDLAAIGVNSGDGSDV